MTAVFWLLLGVLIPLTVAEAQTPGQCKRKVAGFYLQYADLTTPRALATSAQGIRVSLTGALGDPTRGRTVLVDKSKGDCLSCHRLATEEEPDQGDVGPPLDGIGSRYNEAQLRHMMIDPGAYFPGTIMPSYHNPQGGQAASILSAAEIEDLVAFMKNLK